MIRRLLFVLGAIVLVASACGGGGDETTSTTTAAPTVAASSSTTATTTTTTTTAAPTSTTATPVNVGSGDFCANAENNETLIDGIDFLSADLETAATQWLAAIDAAQAAAPPEIANDVGVIAAAANVFVQILVDADFQALNIDPEDPRLAALDDGSLDAAIANIEAYCGSSFGGDDSNDGGAGGGGEFGSDPLPEFMTAAITPPNILGVDDNGVAGLNIATSLGFEDTVSFFENALGATGVADDGSTTITGQFEGATWIVIVQGIDESTTLATILRV